MKKNEDRLAAVPVLLKSGQRIRTDWQVSLYLFADAARYKTLRNVSVGGGFRVAQVGASTLLPPDFCGWPSHGMPGRALDSAGQGV
jgi:hypothetical protein